jgi:hypothetical protein
MYLELLIVYIVHNNGKAYNVVVNGDWYGYGFEEPSFTAGQTISFNYRENGKFKNIDKASVQVSGSAAPAKSAPVANAAPARNDDRQLSIVHQSSRNAAIELVGVLLQNSAVSMPAKKADQADAVWALVTHYTNLLHNEHDKTIEAGGPTPEGFEPTENGQDF